MNKLSSNQYLIKCFLVVAVCFIFDSTISFFLPYNYTKDLITIIPFTGLMMFTLIIKSIVVPERYFFAGVCGIYYSVVYSNTLAIYILIYILIAFCRTYIYRFDRLTFFESLFICILTIIVHEFIVYWLMIVTGITYLDIIPFLTSRVLPTVLLNLFLYVFIYHLSKRVTGGS